MDDMNAKHLIKSNLQEADPGAGGPPRRSMPPRRSGPPGGGPPEDIRRMTGREEQPKGQFSPEETSQLKDVMIMMLAQMMGSDLDAKIGQALMTGQELEKGQLQHILDEARQLQIPESHGALLQKIFTTLQQG
jgi:hypothetical protein